MSELRQDPISKEWVIIAPERSKRPRNFSREKISFAVPKDNCPFEDLSASGNAPIETFPTGSESWEIAIIPNKYPILEHSNQCAQTIENGLFKVVSGIGAHELVITKDHDKNFPKLSKEDACELFRVFKQRYSELSKDKCSEYISLFHTWGPKAGASVYHPHYQILALPLVPPDISRSVQGSDDYFVKNSSCAHCNLIKSDLEDGKRIIFENSEAIAVAPFVSRQPFEVRIFPKKHSAFFERTEKEILDGVSEALQFILSKIEKNLEDTDYNFFIHTSPLKHDNDNYHWHIEVLPKSSILGGLEWGTGVIVNTVDPETVPQILKE